MRKALRERTKLGVTDKVMGIVVRLDPTDEQPEMPGT